jgi:hypothetical protein
MWRWRCLAGHRVGEMRERERGVKEEREGECIERCGGGGVWLGTVWGR